MFAIVFLLIITPCFSASVSKTQTDKLKDFDKMTDKDKTKAIYQECLVANSKPTMSTGGTEYQPNDNARIFARLLDGNSRPINSASCNSTVYFPNNTKLLNNVPLTLLEKGVYYYDFVTPNITGNYITLFDCVTPSIPFKQNVTFVGLELSLDDPQHDYYYGFDDTNNVTINSAYLEVKTTGSLVGSILGVNFNNRNLGTITGINPAMVNYTLTSSDFYLTEEQFLLLTREGTGTNSPIWIRLVVNYVWNDPQQLIRGQDEVHVSNTTSSISSQLNNIPSQVWNFTPNRNLTYYPNVTADVNYTYFNQQFNQTWFNQQTIYNFVQSMNTTMVTFQELVKPQIQDIWDYVQEIMDSINGLIIS